MIKELLKFCQISVFDLTALVFVEIFTRNIFPGRASSKTTLLSSQLGFLTILCVIFLLHHPPYLLFMFAFGVLCALLWNLLLLKQNEVLSSNVRNRTRNMFYKSSNTSYHPNVLDPSYPSSSGSLQLNMKPRPVQKQIPVHQTFCDVDSSGDFSYRMPLEKPLLTQTSLATSSRRKPALSQVLPLNNFSFSSVPKATSYPPGFVNSGNTCFINSILQCLTWIPGFTSSLTQAVDEENVNSQVLSEVVKLMLSVHRFSNKHLLSVDTVCLLLKLSSFAHHLVSSRVGLSYQSQQDSAEFLLWLLNHLHLEITKNQNSFFEADILALKQDGQSCFAELSKMKSTDKQFNRKLFEYVAIEWHLYTSQSKSVVYEHFLGQLLEARECQLCNKVSLSIEYFIVLPLPLPTSAHSRQVFSLEVCFSLFSEVEDLVNTNMITCSCVIPNKKSLTPGRRRSLISKTPKNLIIQLSRYSYKTGLRRTIKNCVCVKFDTTFTLPISIKSQLGNIPHTKAVYQLVGICLHSGADSTSNGHYVAYCQTTMGWFYFNDEKVQKISDINRELQSYFILQNAYLLFYCKIKTE